MVPMHPRPLTAPPIISTEILPPSLLIQLRSGLNSSASSVRLRYLTPFPILLLSHFALDPFSSWRRCWGGGGGGRAGRGGGGGGGGAGAPRGPGARAARPTLGGGARGRPPPPPPQISVLARKSRNAWLHSSSAKRSKIFNRFLGSAVSSLTASNAPSLLSGNTSNFELPSDAGYHGGMGGNSPQYAPLKPNHGISSIKPPGNLRHPLPVRENRTTPQSAPCRSSGLEDTRTSRRSWSRLALSRIARSTAAWAELASTGRGRRTVHP